MQVITSTRNPRVKALKALQQRRNRELAGRFLVEGIRTVETAIQANAPIEQIVYAPPLLEDARGQDLLAQASARGIRLTAVSENVLKAVADTQTPSGVVAVARREPAKIEAMVIPACTLVVADLIQDPGNLGTIVRLADAVGCTGVVVTPGTVDPYHPKAVRASAGSIFHLSVVVIEEAEAEAAALLIQRNLRVLVADAHGEKVYTEVDYSPPVAVVFGNEAAGVSTLWRSITWATVRIPIYGRAESLNVASAAAVLLYEMASQIHLPTSPSL